MNKLSSVNFQPVHWFLICFLLVLPFLACGSLGAKKEEPPKPPSGQIVPNTEASERAHENFNQAMQEASGNNEFRFRITNEEITSIVAAGLAQRADIPFSEPQIWFTAGKVHITGKLEGIGPTALPALIIAIPKVAPDGQLVVEVDEAKMGSFGFPESVIESITETTNQTLADLQLNIQITGIEVLEGEMIVAGKRNE